MRVLIASVSAYGHLQPLLPLAKALADAGHEVAIATGSDLRSRAEAAGFPAFDAGITPGVAFELLAERYPDQEYNRLNPAEILGWYLPHLFGEVLTPAMLGDLESILEPPDAPDAAPHTARRVDLRFRAPFLVGDTVVIDYEVDGDTVRADAYLPQREFVSCTRANLTPPPASPWTRRRGRASLSHAPPRSRARS